MKLVQTDARAMIARLVRDRAGASAAEVVLVLPIMTILLFGAVDVAGLAWTKIQVGAAARAGASYALTSGFDEAGITSAATNATGLAVTVGTPTQSFGCPNETTGITETADDSTACPDSGDLPGEYVTVDTSADYSPIFGWPGLSDPVPLAAQAQVRIS